ncbi:hypothetical protein B0T18DRAFT_427041 [Schizothecium vesticola]|uniref:Secreted protein n=1 Tax=Schizothecium vesticola TaxID=314040 RepID=A0AA40F8B2_9PEZI|nr:hypothetical protein B0T18DRAFT_427041 [Schizothecium vesticola]
MDHLIHVLMTLLLALSAMASPAVVAIHEPRAAAAAPNQKALNCGIFSTADKHDFMDMQSYWAVTKGEMCTTPAKTCRRYACKNTSGIYICNDSTAELKLNCTVFHDFTNSIGGKCCTKDYHDSKGISGRQWSDQDFNVVVAYGNCNHGIDSDKPAPGPKNDPWGPNGLCEDD